MAPFETREHHAARQARDRERYPELEVADLEEIARVDQYSRRDGEAVSSFGRALEDAFVRLGLPPEETLGRGRARGRGSETGAF
jgi:hypothetical protein